MSDAVIVGVNDEIVAGDDDLGLARGKNTIDKRETLKERDQKREMDRAVKRPRRER